METSAQGPKFLTDAMLGGLTRWLRVLGFDTLFNPAEDDRELVRIADAEKRVLLTRDKHLVTHLRPTCGLLIQANAPLEQLNQVVSECQLSIPDDLFTRCLLCNTTLECREAEDLPEDVPPGAPAGHEPVRHCPHCRKYYWEGSHTRRMRHALAKALPHRVAQANGNSGDPC